MHDLKTDSSRRNLKKFELQNSPHFRAFDKALKCPDQISVVSSFHGVKGFLIKNEI